MKFVAGRDPETTQALMALSLDRGFTGDGDVRATSVDGYLVRDEVFNAWSSGQLGELKVIISTDGLVAEFTAEPQVPTLYTTDGIEVLAPDGRLGHKYPKAGSYPVKAVSPGRTPMEGVVKLVAKPSPHSTRRKSTREAQHAE